MHCFNEVSINRGEAVYWNVPKNHSLWLISSTNHVPELIELHWDIFKGNDLKALHFDDLLHDFCEFCLQKVHVTKVKHLELHSLKIDFTVVEMYFLLTHADRGSSFECFTVFPLVQTHKIQQQGNHTLLNYLTPISSREKNHPFCHFWKVNLAGFNKIGGQLSVLPNRFSYTQRTVETVFFTYHVFYKFQYMPWCWSTPRAPGRYQTTNEKLEFRKKSYPSIPNSITFILSIVIPLWSHDSTVQHLCDHYVCILGASWRIIPGLVSGKKQWLVSPLSRVVPLPNDLNGL